MFSHTQLNQAYVRYRQLIFPTLRNLKKSQTALCCSHFAFAMYLPNWISVKPCLPSDGKQDS